MDAAMQDDEGDRTGRRPASSGARRRASVPAVALALGLAALSPSAASAQDRSEPVDSGTHRPSAAFDRAVSAYDRGDFETAYREWLPLAQSGDPAAMRNVAHLLRFGRGVPKDAAAAAAWYRRAGEAGFDRAQANLGSLYLTGEGVPQDHAKAAEWFELAARQGHTVAQYNLGLLYEHGLGRPRDEPRALAWYNLAARGGHPKALEKLSQLVLQPPGDTAAGEPPAAATSAPAAEAAEAAEAAGGGSTPDAAAAADTAGGGIFSFVTSLFGERPAGATSPPLPPPNPGMSTAPPSAGPPLPMSGAGVPPPVPRRIVSASAGAGAGAADPVQAGVAAFQSGDYQAALAHWLPAAKSGDARAQYHLGMLYREGQGVPADPVRSHMWWTLASRQGHGQSGSALAQLEGRMSRSEIAEATALANSFTLD